MSSDAYLDTISPESLKVLEHFGAEAPAILNAYCCTLEDALIKALQEQPIPQTLFSHSLN